MALETLPAGVQRTYRFTVAFPDSGPHGADNACIGSALRMDYEWRAEPAPRRRDCPTAPAPPRRRARQRRRRRPPDPRRSRITIRVPHQRVMHTAAVRLFASCDVACTVRFGGRAVTAPRSRRARRAVLMRRHLFRGEKKVRALPVTSERAVKLKLSRRVAASCGARSTRAGGSRS